MLNALHDRNEALFLRVVCKYIDEIQPMIYTPTVGLACQSFGHIFQRPRGLSCQRKRPWPRRRSAAQLARIKARLIVVTDGERILGLGDLGANGMGIPVGKLCAVFRLRRHPSRVMPAGDARRRHQQSRSCCNDPFYLGLRQPPRGRGRTTTSSSMNS